MQVQPYLMFEGRREEEIGGAWRIVMRSPAGALLGRSPTERRIH
jgi:hypothetical protein